MKEIINNSNSTMNEHETSTNVLGIEVFLNERYAFRHNVLSGKTEFAKKAEDGTLTEYRVLTQKALNSILIQAKREDVFEEGGSKSDIEEYINSEEVESYDPIQHYLNNLPAWDGQNHVARLFSRLPGISSEQLNFLTIWMRSAVAHWLQMDVEHGNECVPTLIGAQGCGKTTERTPHLWCLAGRPSSLCVVRSHYKQSASADRPHRLAPLHLHDDS